nr:beta-xylosidase [uncultured bacterium]
MRKCLVLFAALLFPVVSTSQSKSTLPPYKDPSLPVERRVADLLSRMTLEEKIAQIGGLGHRESDFIDANGKFDPIRAEPIFRNGAGMAGRAGLHRTPRQGAELYNTMQRYFLEHTRLGIPALFSDEALHGFMSDGSTSFPQALGLASTWDPALVHDVFTAAADEGRARGGTYVFTPVLDLAREPRWGRTEETYGEDPYLISRMGVAAITGLQGPGPNINKHHLLATAKHFTAHGQPESGTNTAPANFSERELRTNYLRPFQAAITEAGAGSVMASYNEIDAVPSHINRWLLTNVLRQEWGFRGLLVSDGGALEDLVNIHHVAADYPDAARKALAAGVDYDLSDGSVYRTLLQQVRDGLVPEAEVDNAVARVLRAKFLMGLFDDPYVDPDYAERTNNSPEHRALALKAAQKTIVLLKNEQNLLPLDLARLKTIAVIGPNAADYHPGGYSVDPGHAVTILEGIRNYVGSRAKVTDAEGCKITTTVQGWKAWWEDKVELADPATQQESIRQAVAAAKAADVAILVVGENEGTNREGWNKQHLGDRDSLDLLGAQDQLVKAVVETGTPTVVLLLNGRPLSINYIAEHVPAILEGWYLGQEGGTAAAQVLFGDINPGGKLPITFPRSVGQLPDYYNYKPSARRGYLFHENKPLFPFGYGLSYTIFKFDKLRVEPQKIGPGGQAKVSVDITNTGQREGDEVAQLYVHQRVSSVTRAIKQLEGFQRVSLKPGEKKTVEFSVGPNALALIGNDMLPVVEPGMFDLMVGPNSVDTSSVALEVAPVP